MNISAISPYTSNSGQYETSSCGQAFQNELLGFLEAQNRVSAASVDFAADDWDAFSKNPWACCEPSEETKLFYQERFGLTGLTREEQIKAVMGGLMVSTEEEIRMAAGILFKAGAITSEEHQKLLTQISLHSANISAKPGSKVDWGGMLDTLDGVEGMEELYNALFEAWGAQKKRAEEDAKDAELKIVLQRVDALQAAIREEIARRLEKQQKNELLESAAAENARLRVLFGLTDGTDTDAVDLGLELSGTEASAL